MSGKETQQSHFENTKSTNSDKLGTPIHDKGISSIENDVKGRVTCFDAAKDHGRKGTVGNETGDGSEVFKTAANVVDAELESFENRVDSGIGCEIIEHEQQKRQILLERGVSRALKTPKFTSFATERLKRASAKHDSASTHQTSSLLPSSSSRGAASSEEDSVAEMDYMNEEFQLFSKNGSASADLVVCDKSQEYSFINCYGDFSSQAFQSFENKTIDMKPPPVLEAGWENSIRNKKYSSASPPNETNAALAETNKSLALATNNPNSRTCLTASTFVRPQSCRTIYSSSSCGAAGAIAETPVDNDDCADCQTFLAADSCLNNNEHHRPLSLPKFRDPHISMWTASHAANCPTEDRSASMVNILLQPLPPNFDSETQLPSFEPDYKTLIRINLWSVIDGHGGGCVATYASEVLLPHIAASISRALGCAIVDRGVCTVNGQLRDANALDLDGLIRTTNSDCNLANPNSIQYRSHYESSDWDEDGPDTVMDATLSTTFEEQKLLLSIEKTKAKGGTILEKDSEERQPISNVREVASTSGLMKKPFSVATRQGALSRHDPTPQAGISVSSAKTSVKTAASPANQELLIGTHSPTEVSAITRAITESFLAVDEGWINSIDPVATHQTSCQSNGRWNSGACALVVLTIQRLDWTNISEPDREIEICEFQKSRRNTLQNRDAARRRMLDFAARAKGASFMSTISSASSITTEEAVNVSGPESEITETEGEDDRADTDKRRRNLAKNVARENLNTKESFISPPDACFCHCYRAHEAILYTAHVGDCRAVMLGSAPPRTIKVRDSFQQDTTDDESSHHSSDETECLSSSDHDADSSEDEDVNVGVSANTPILTPITASESSTSPTPATTTGSYINFPRRVVRQKSSRLRATEDAPGPFIALPPLQINECFKDAKSDFETTVYACESQQSVDKDPSISSGSSQDTFDSPPLVNLPPSIRPIDLTTDHSAYNPVEVTAVLRRCNNAPRAISAGVGGGIKRVAGSLAVTRALGDAYLKTPHLSFLPYKRHAPYITARPEINCRPIVKDGDKMLIFATDGVWERASGEDVLRWVRNFYEERVAEAERRKNRPFLLADKALDTAKHSDDERVQSKMLHEGTERDLFERSDVEVSISSIRKRSDHGGRSLSPVMKRRKRSRQNRVSYNVADVIVRRVLNKVRRARNISSLQALMSLPQGRARRSKHDDITASVVDLSAFIS